MLSSSSSHCLIPSLPRLAPRLNPRSRPKSIVMVGNRGTDGWDLDSGRVDEDMIVLRKRIQEIRTADDESASNPSGWTRWEREYYVTTYPEDVCEFVGLLQRWLMSTRPSVAVGTVLLVLVSVPTSFGFLLYHIIGMSGSVMSALHSN